VFVYGIDWLLKARNTLLIILMMMIIIIIIIIIIIYDHFSYKNCYQHINMGPV